MATEPGKVILGFDVVATHGHGDRNQKKAVVKNCACQGESDQGGARADKLERRLVEGPPDRDEHGQPGGVRIVTHLGVCMMMLMFIAAAPSMAYWRRVDVRHRRCLGELLGPEQRTLTKGHNSCALNSVSHVREHGLRGSVATRIWVW